MGLAAGAQGRPKENLIILGVQVKSSFYKPQATKQNDALLSNQHFLHI